MAKYRKKPVVIEAYQSKGKIQIETADGTMIANPGDWVVTSPNGLRWPYKDEEFREKYEPVED